MVLDLPERRMVFVECEQPRLKLQRELLRQLRRRRHEPLLILDERRLALVQMLRVAPPAAHKPRQPVVQDVVRALAERLHLEIAAAVADEQPRVHLLAQDAAPPDRDQLAHAGNRPYLTLHVLPDGRGAVLHHVLDAALVEPAHNVVEREQEPELLLLQVVALAVRPLEPGLDDRRALEPARHIIPGELQRLADPRAQHDVRVVPHIVILHLGEHRQPHARGEDRQQRGGGRLAPAPVREDVELVVRVRLRHGLQVRISGPVRRPVQRTLLRHRLARTLRRPHIAPGPDRADHRTPLAEVGHHLPVSAHGGVGVVLDVGHVAFQPRVGGGDVAHAPAVNQGGGAEPLAVAAAVVGVELAADGAVGRHALGGELLHHAHPAVRRRGGDLQHVALPLDHLHARLHRRHRRKFLVSGHLHILAISFQDSLNIHSKLGVVFGVRPPPQL